MKKKLTLYMLVASIGATGLISSCTDLDEEVYSEVLASSFHPTEKDIPAIVAPVYASFRGLMMGWQGYFDLQEESADAIITPARPNGWYDGGTYLRMHEHRWDPLQWQPENTWQSAYRSITTANRVISQIEDGDIAIENGKESLMAELKAARAFAYYLLLDNHGNVPIVTDYRDASLPKQSTRQEVYDFVIKELTDALPLLSDDPSSTYGQLNKWGVKALLAKIYLNAEVYTGTPQWEKCIQECNDIISSGKYVLDPNYSDVFTWTNQNSKEIIFAVPYDEIYGPQNQVHMKTLDPLSRFVYAMQAGPWGGNCAVPQFIDTYDEEDGRLGDTWIMGPQKSATTGEVVIDYQKDVPSMAGTESNDGYRIGKYAIKMGATGGLDNDYPMFRYADVLMMKAESLLRTGRAAEAAELVSQVRERAFRATNPDKAVVTGDELMQGSTYEYGYQEEDGSITDKQGGADIKYGRFLDELGWEFAAEAHRRQDLIRFGVFSTKAWFNHRPSDPTKTLFPIPEGEISKNPNLTQNPGY
ncbi:RagB/SusD family nutrient uptake outer membrane protein [Pontibacter sp. 172403-2]|uniref:RagB/SusD family nutrient uptake outer membrane protein n=1 Tax=Pontibacter rufus TaxID=2791028 RepID=UPI0018AF812F|nr:RagB/SusD family nutrient uptake outer membrane protein [Pontibacter sp. 172403-2]MBF9254076.1 RagB/SusD family nutrient uptake outer membrane protein [Pontibacter sp. 172403-2]